MDDLDQFDLERLGRIIVEIRRHSRQQLDGRLNEGISTCLRKSLSSGDFLFWQTMQQSLADSCREHETTGWCDVQDVDEFEQLFGQYKRAGYELIASIYQQGQTHSNALD